MWRCINKTIAVYVCMCMHIAYVRVSSHVCAYYFSYLGLPNICVGIYSALAYRPYIDVNPGKLGTRGCHDPKIMGVEVVEGSWKGCRG